jgi:2-oxoglutarate/2-oxoacid ferredoxin oxidoreductase subunit beta
MNEVASRFDSDDPIAWCPGCGDFGILAAVKQALGLLDKRPSEVLLVSGIGQAAKLPHYVRANCLNGLHGRALAAATGAKIANRLLTVIVTTGDGDCYGEGGNHFLHAVRRNVDMTVVVHDNQIYGLTKGQASPTTDTGYVTKVQTRGVSAEPLHPLQLAIALGCGFVARGFSGEKDHLAALIVEGVRHRGFSLIDVLQPCVSFNRKNTFAWYSQRVYKIEQDTGFDRADRNAAFAKAGLWGDKIPLGIIYKEEKPCYEEKAGLETLKPLVDYDPEDIALEEILGEFA